MGCNTSRLSPEDYDNKKARLRNIHSLIGHRLAEIRIRTRSGEKLKDITPSKKELLDHGGGEEREEGPSSLEDENTAACNINNSGKTQVGTKEDDIGDRNRKEEAKEKGVVENNNVISKERNGDRADEEEDDDEEGKERMLSCKSGGEMSIRSPSFRVYCEDVHENEKEDTPDDNNEDNRKEHSSHEKSPSDGSESIVWKSSNGEQERKTSKKGERGRGIKKVIKMGVSSCYYIPGCSSQDRATLLAQKTAAA